MDNLTDIKLVELASRGDGGAFERLVLRHQNSVYSQALRITGDRQDAQDVAQDVFIRIYRSLSSFKGDCAFSTWVYRVCSNMCIDFMRKNRKNAALSLAVIETDDGGEIELDIPDLSDSPHERYETTERMEILERCLSALPADMREILILREIQGLNYQEIADSLMLEEGTVKSRLSRARKRLCALLLDSHGNIFSSYSSKNNERGGERP